MTKTVWKLMATLLLLYSQAVNAQAVSGSTITISNSWDGVLQSDYYGSVQQLIGTYQGWDNKAIYIGGYNKNNGPFVTERVIFGNPVAGGFMSLDFMTGNVGIGTLTTGANKLAVEGTIGARRIRIMQSAWADYVFADKYRLPSLKEVEHYIKQHRHLPEVPTEEEVKRDGVDIGDTQVLLLKKIEELTLYLIDQNKQIELLRKEVEELKKKKD